MFLFSLLALISIPNCMHILRACGGGSQVYRLSHVANLKICRKHLCQNLTNHTPRARVARTREYISETDISAVNETMRTKGKYKENQRVFLKVWLIYSRILATMLGTPQTLTYLPS
jgi:hypothetical protein